MRTKLYLLLLAPFGLACQPDDRSEFSIEPGTIAYNDEAPYVTKSICGSGDCQTPLNQEQYTYTTDGKLKQIKYMSRTTTAALEMYAYVDYSYNTSGQLAGKVRYSKYAVGNTWVAYEESEYEYADGFLKTEKTYFNRQSPVQRVLIGRIEYDMKDGKKVGQKWYDDNQNLLRQSTFTYKNNILTQETLLDNKGTLIRTFEHSFAGNRRQIGEIVPKTKERVALIEKTYDIQGRLASEETKVSNPLLCVMSPGVIKYTY